MEQTTVIGKLRVEVVADAATVAEIIQFNCLEVGDELKVEDLIDAAAMLVQGLAFRLLRWRVPVDGLRAS